MFGAVPSGIEEPIKRCPSRWPARRRGSDRGASTADLVGVGETALVTSGMPAYSLGIEIIAELLRAEYSKAVAARGPHALGHHARSRVGGWSNTSETSNSGRRKWRTSSVSLLRRPKARREGAGHPHLHI